MALLGCSSASGTGLTASRVDPPFEVSDVALEGGDGPVSLATDLDAPLTLVFFGYTHCKDICPTVLASLAAGLNQLDDDDRDRVDVYFVTSDPRRDTLPVLARYLGRFDPSYRGLTGDLPDIVTVGKSIGVYVDEGEELSDGGYDPNAHGTYLLALDNEGRAPAFWRMDTAPSQFAHDIRVLLDQET